LQAVNDLPNFKSRYAAQQLQKFTIACGGPSWHPPCCAALTGSANAALRAPPDGIFSGWRRGA
jgi:hypothetical protein